MRKQRIKARIIYTSEIVTLVDHGDGVFVDPKTMKVYRYSEFSIIPVRNMWRIGFNIMRVGAFLYVRNYVKYAVWYITPAITIEAIKGADFNYLDIELKFIVLGFGLRFNYFKK